MTLTGPSSINGIAVYSVDLNGFTLTLDGNVGVTNITGVAAIHGNGTVVKTGTGTWDCFLYGSSFLSSDWSGSTIVNAGTLEVAGTITGPITVYSGGTLSATQHALHIVGPVNVNGGDVSIDG